MSDEIRARFPVIHLNNALVEAGILYCRKLLNFLGIVLDRRTNTLIVPRPGVSTMPDDRVVTHLGMSAWEVPRPGTLHDDCVKVITWANRGVAHFTEDKGDRAQAQTCLNVVEYLTNEIITKVFEPLSRLPAQGREKRVVPPHRPWTNLGR